MSLYNSFLAPEIPTLSLDEPASENTVEEPEQKVENSVEEVNNSEDSNETQNATHKVAENAKTPDLVVEENGKFSVHSGQDEVSEPAESSQKSDDEEQKTAKSTSRAQSATSSWSVTESHTDEYKVSFSPFLFSSVMSKVLKAKIIHQMMSRIYQEVVS